MSYFAAALALSADGWTGRELDLGDIADLDALADELRDLTGDGPGPALLLFEEDDEYVAFVRVDGSAGSLTEPRIFLSDGRAVLQSEHAAMLWEDTYEAPKVSDKSQDEDDEDQDDDEEEDGHPASEPVGDRDLLSDLGTPAAALLRLCSEEGLLPADLLTVVGERAGFVDVLEGLRDA